MQKEMNAKHKRKQKYLYNTFCMAAFLYLSELCSLHSFYQKYKGCKMYYSERLKIQSALIILYCIFESS